MQKPTSNTEGWLIIQLSRIPQSTSSSPHTIDTSIKISLKVIFVLHIKINSITERN